MILEHLIPFIGAVASLAAVFALVVFNEKTKRLAFVTASLAILAELIPTSLNITALAVCIGCFVSMLLIQYLRSHWTLNKSLRKQ